MRDLTKGRLILAKLMFGIFKGEKLKGDEEAKKKGMKSRKL